MHDCESQCAQFRMINVPFHFVCLLSTSIPSIDLHGFGRRQNPRRRYSLYVGQAKFKGAN